MPVPYALCIRHAQRVDLHGLEPASYQAVALERSASSVGLDERARHLVKLRSERAALALTDATTRLADGEGVPDAIWQDAVTQWGDGGAAKLVFVIAVINAWNRLAVAARPTPRSAWGGARRGGGHEAENLTLLCSGHHRALHASSDTVAAWTGLGYSPKEARAAVAAAVAHVGSNAELEVMIRKALRCCGKPSRLMARGSSALIDTR